MLKALRHFILNANLRSGVLFTPPIKGTPNPGFIKMVFNAGLTIYQNASNVIIKDVKKPEIINTRKSPCTGIEIHPRDLGTKVAGKKKCRFQG